MLAAVAAATPAAAAPGPRLDALRAKPAPLYPSFSPSVVDYVSRCNRRKPLRLVGRAGKGQTVAIDGDTPDSGRFSARVRLSAGQSLALRVRAGRRAATYRVRCLPPRFTKWTARRTGVTEAQYYLVLPDGPGPARYVAIFDANGVPVWWTHTGSSGIDAELLPGGHIAWARFFDAPFGTHEEGAYEEHRLDGRRVRTLRAVGSATDIHDLQQLENGHFLLLSYPQRDGVDLRPYGGPANATVVDGVIQELTPAGELVWSWNSADHIALSETGRWWQQLVATPATLPDGRKAYDVVHLNSVEPHGDRLLVSARHTDSLYDIDRRTGEIRWKLGGTETPQSLSIAGDSRYGKTTFGGQHDARLPTDDTVTVYDNGTGRGRPPRAVRYRIDAARGTATLVDELTNPAVASSPYAGSARRLAHGHWVVAWGGAPAVTEMKPSGTPVFRLTFPKGWFSYRAIPLPPGRLSHAALVRGMEAQYPRR